MREKKNALTRISFNTSRATRLVVIFPLQTSLDDEPFRERSALPLPRNHHRRRRRSSLKLSLIITYT